MKTQALTGQVYVPVDDIKMFNSIFLTFLLQSAWTLKTRALTGQVYVDEVDWDEEGIAEMLMDDNVTAQVSRPGTSLRQPGTGQGGVSQGVR